MTNIWWPQQPRTDTTVLVRLGRVAHWIGTLFGGLLGIICLWAGFVDNAGTGALILGPILFAGFSLAGRAFRYVLGGE